MSWLLKYYAEGSIRKHHNVSKIPQGAAVVHIASVSTSAQSFGHIDMASYCCCQMFAPVAMTRAPNNEHSTGCADQWDIWSRL